MGDWKDYKGQSPWSASAPSRFLAHKGAGRWLFDKSPDKYEYNIGDDIATFEEQRWTNDANTGVPITPGHRPCGYWWDEPRVSTAFWFTSKVYPILAFDPDTMSDYAIDVSATMIAGNFRAIVRTYDEWPVESLDVECALASGVFRAAIHTYEYEESLDVEVTFQSGVFRAAIHSYEMDVESIDVETELKYGVFRDALVKEENWPFEALDVETTLVGGTHYVP